MSAHISTCQNLDAARMANISEKVRSADHILKLFEQLQATDARGSGCMVVSSQVGYEMILKDDADALARLGGLIRAGNEPLALLKCSAEGKISVENLGSSAPVDELMMARVRETFEAMHYAKLLYPNLRQQD